jgi:gamma-glutamylcyclotransferase
MTSQSEPSYPQYTPAFGYGSNILDKQMKDRCPDNVYVGIAKLDGWKWIINSRGVATIISSPADHVWGTVLLLHDYDKKILDGKEGPRYIQCHLPVDIKGVKRSPRPVLIYIEFNEEFGLPRTEYVGRLKNAMIDGLAKGIPQAYFDKYWLPFLMPSNPGIYTISEIHTPPATPLLLTRDAGAGVTVRHPYSDHGPEQQWRITPGQNDGNIIIKSVSEPSAYLTYQGAPGKPKEGYRLGLQVSDLLTTQWRVKVSPRGNHFIRPASSGLGVKYVDQGSPDVLALGLEDQVEWVIGLNHADTSEASSEQ